MALLDLQALELSSELKGYGDRSRCDCDGSFLSLLLCS
ncbi:MAG: SapB/AmfS family lanthipeptide [Actinomycetota bacterium]|nr:SapB/AmfS family lanthipeptide [Actinomycetota bacterium]